MTSRIGASGHSPSSCGISLLEMPWMVSSAFSSLRPISCSDTSLARLSTSTLSAVISWFSSEDVSAASYSLRASCNRPRNREISSPRVVTFRASSDFPSKVRISPRTPASSLSTVSTASRWRSVSFPSDSATSG